MAVAKAVPSANPMTTDDLPNLPYHWTAHPVRERPIRGVCAAILTVVTGVLVGRIVADPTVGPLAAGGAMLFLLISLNRFFLPTHYRIDEQGIHARFPLRQRSLAWSEIRRFPHDHEGGYVSARERGGAFDTRGVSLLYHGHATQVIALIKSRWSGGSSKS